MKQEDTSAGLRLFFGLAVGALVGTAMGRCVDLVSVPTAILTSCLSVLVGFLSTYLLKEGLPRRESPSSMGTVALLLVLACYLVIGHRLLELDNLFSQGMFALAGVVLLFLIFTSVAEGSLLYAFGIGGFCGGVGGLIALLIFKGQFAPLFDLLSGDPGELKMVYAYMAILCMIPSAFAAVAGRLSGWGLVEHTKEDVWAFNADGRLYVKKATRTTMARS